MHKTQVKEADILTALRKYLRIRGWYVIRHQQGMGCHKGMSDLTAIKDGKTVYLECKSPRGGKQSDDQVKFQQCIEGHGGIYCVVASFDDVIATVDQL